MTELFPKFRSSAYTFLASVAAVFIGFGILCLFERYKNPLSQSELREKALIGQILINSRQLGSDSKKVLNDVKSEEILNEQWNANARVQLQGEREKLDILEKASSDHSFQQK